MSLLTVEFVEEYQGNEHWLAGDAHVWFYPAQSEWRCFTCDRVYCQHVNLATDAAELRNPKGDYLGIPF